MGDEGPPLSRKHFTSQLINIAGVGMVFGSGVIGAANEAEANGMLDFPPLRLNNR